MNLMKNDHNDSVMNFQKRNEVSNMNVELSEMEDKSNMFPRTHSR